MLFHSVPPRLVGFGSAGISVLPRERAQPESVPDAVEYFSVCFLNNYEVIFCRLH